MKTSTKRTIFGLGLLFLIGLILLVLLLGWFNRRGQAFNARPLVLVHAPMNNKRLQVGDRVTIHATTREQEGLERIELWVDGKLMDVVDAEDPAPKSMVFSSQWVPTSTGTHLLIIRAFSSKNVPGQSSIRVLAEQAGEAPTGSHQVEEGETLAAIAEQYDLSTEELEEANPELGEDGPAPGQGLTIPDREPAAEEESLPPAEETSEEPTANAAEPLPSILAIFGNLQFFGPEADTVPLRVEVTRLQTQRAFEGMHCYVSLAGSLPQWYPDADQDQATDESFIHLGGGNWQTEPYLTGQTAPLINWTEDQPLPFTLNSVGITGGGTEAVELGTYELELEPWRWDGIAREFRHQDHTLNFSIRVTRADSGSRLVPLYIDPSMTSPHNVRPNEQNRTLEWDYSPDDDEDPIDGFRIYLNGNLQWVEDPEARETGIPYEWFNPPCGSNYTFGVSAFIIEFPDGPESYPGLTIINQPLEDCNREILIVFTTLETHVLGGDGRWEDRHGDIGPVYGTFFANDQQITFDGGHERGHLDKPNGLKHTHLYTLGDGRGSHLEFQRAERCCGRCPSRRDFRIRLPAHGPGYRAL